MNSHERDNRGRRAHGVPLRRTFPALPPRESFVGAIFWGQWMTTLPKLRKVDRVPSRATVRIHKDTKPSKLLSASS
jgi:hypothetical protein